MKPLIFQVSEYDVGRLGIHKRDIGRWCVLVQGAIHFRESEASARELLEYLK